MKKIIITSIIVICFISNCSKSNKNNMDNVISREDSKNSGMLRVDNKENIDKNVEAHAPYVLPDNRNETTEVEVIKNKCISPQFTTYYPNPSSDYEVFPNESILPLLPWQQMNSLTDKIDQKQTSKISLLSLPNYMDKDYMLVSADIENGLKSYFLLNVNDNNVNLIMEDTDVTVSIPIAISSNNGLWVRNYQRDPNLINNKFVNISFQSFIDNSISDFKIELEDYFRIITLIDEEDNIWLISENDRIYKYNYKTLELLRLSNISIVDISNPVLKYGKIFFIGKNMFNDIKDDEYSLFEYDISTNEYKQIHIGLNSPIIFPSLLVDKNRKIWIDELGWLDVDDNWYQLFPPRELFVKKEIQNNVYTIYAHPSIILESSDGFLWYKSAAGTTSYNPKSGEWCLFSDYSSNIVEDSKGNIWMIADGQLYKRPLVEK